jgi:hypothetical protein
MSSKRLRNLEHKYKHNFSIYVKWCLGEFVLQGSGVQVQKSVYTGGFSLTGPKRVLTLLEGGKAETRTHSHRVEYSFHSHNNVVYFPPSHPRGIFETASISIKHHARTPRAREAQNLYRPRHIKYYYLHWQ